MAGLRFINRGLALSILTLAQALAVAFAAGPAAAYDGKGIKREGFANETPKELENIGITEHLGDKLDLSLEFRNEAGEKVPLKTYFNGKKPVLLTMAYYNCPSLCGFHLNGLKDVFKKLQWTIGREFDVVVVSIDPREGSDLAAAKKKSYIEAYGRSEGAAGWHFLTGDEPQIQALAKAVGFGYRWDEEQKQYAHAAAAYVITPEGQISRYLYGIDFQPQTLRLSLVEASGNKVGSVVDKLILYCFHYDPKENKYTIAAVNVMKMGGALTVLILAGFMTPFWLRQRREEKRLQGEV